MKLEQGLLWSIKYRYKIYRQIYNWLFNAWAYPIIPNKIGLSANCSNMVKMQIAMEITIRMIASSLQRFFFKIKINKCVDSSSVSCFIVVLMLQTINMKQPVLRSFFQSMSLNIFLPEWTSDQWRTHKISKFGRFPLFQGQIFWFPMRRGLNLERWSSWGHWCHLHRSHLQNILMQPQMLSHHHSTLNTLRRSDTGKLFTLSPSLNTNWQNIHFHAHGQLWHSYAHSSSSATRTMTTSFSRWHVTFYIFPAPPADPTFRILKPGALTHSYEGRRWRACISPAQLPGSQGAGTQVTEQGGKEGR